MSNKFTFVPATTPKGLSVLTLKEAAVLSYDNAKAVGNYIKIVFEVKGKVKDTSSEIAIVFFGSGASKEDFAIGDNRLTRLLPKLGVEVPDVLNLPTELDEDGLEVTVDAPEVDIYQLISDLNELTGSKYFAKIVQGKNPKNKYEYQIEELTITAK